MAAMEQVAVLPKTENPGGTALTRSRWLIQICCGPEMPSNSTLEQPSKSSGAKPYSPLTPNSTVAPNRCAVSGGLAAGKQPLTVGQAIQRALNNYPSVRVSQEQINAAAAALICSCET